MQAELRESFGLARARPEAGTPEQTVGLRHVEFPQIPGRPHGSMFACVGAGGHPRKGDLRRVYKGRT